ncbi:putative siderophore transport system permease protein YfiZ precursor [Pseudooceanicola marinus]|uniref:Putative siderophore transport system permease protein YfiZ n=1 Tax=Pseudooceanicola marinus TaxID=396013 RepID=A0A1X6YJT4_9RHOB|nr:iron ABC transporter permease [Pseudooceanicola marinus]SLN23504.1 putative siderophore transport system permease protein YfiZ precursor [Pseudooceanicola marinus]
MTGAGRVQRVRTGALTGLAVLALLFVLGLAIGSRPIPPVEVWRALVAFDPGSDLHVIVQALRLPRDLLAVSAGAALGLAGALMQSLTRNPLAEPGLLGVNAGAALAVVLGTMAFGLTSVAGYVWFGFLGAGLAGVAVFVLGRAHDSGTDPVRLILAGAGLTILLGTMTSLLMLNSDLRVLDILRNWQTGTLDGRGYAAAGVMALALLAGGVASVIVAPALDALALGQDLGRTLGLDPRRIWALACLAVMLLAGAATATAGPIAFVGLISPHVARMLAGPANRSVLPLSALMGAIMLLAADILGRVVAMPGEVAAGTVAALIGGPFFVHVVRRYRLVQL